MESGQILLRTTLTVERCAELFHQVGESRCPGAGRSALGPPGPSDPDDPPQLGAVHGAACPVRMTVWDRGDHREVELALWERSCCATGIGADVLDLYIVGFREAELAGDPSLVDPVHDPGLPAATVTMMIRYGRYQLGRSADGEDGAAVVSATQEPLAPTAAEDPVRFVADLARVCLPAGGWAVYGAVHTVVNLLGPQRSDDWFRLLDRAIDFLRSNYVPLARTPPFAVERFVADGGVLEDWLPFREPPDPHSIIITPLADGETRCVVRGGASPASSRVLVTRRQHLFLASIVVEWGAGGGPADRAEQTVIEWKKAHDLYDLYLDIAWSIPSWEWADGELEPFFPAPRALI